MFLDAHIHLQDILEEKPRKEIIERTSADGSTEFFCNAVLPKDWPILSAWGRSDSKIVPFFGIHPWAVNQTVPGWDAELGKYAGQEHAGGIGEIGLDKGKKDLDFEKQKDLFVRQVEIAVTLQKPFTVHCVKAWDAFLKILKRYPENSARWMVHAFSGPKEILSELIRRGAFISISWRKLHYADEDAKIMLQGIPIEKLLIETDFPYLGTVKDGLPPDAENYFRCLREAYVLAAGIRQMELQELAQRVHENGKVFLRGTITG